jgi:hypothetical protein
MLRFSFPADGVLPSTSSARERYAAGVPLVLDRTDSRRN